MSSFRRAAVAAALAGLATASAAAAAGADPGFVVPPAHFAAGADLLGDDRLWDGAGTVQTMTSVTLRRAAERGTTVRFAYDERALYVRFACTQTGVPITATQATNGIGFGVDDYVGVGIDAGGDGQSVFYFETTARGVRYQQSSESARFNPVWEASGKILSPSAWVAVLAVPWSIVRPYLKAGREPRINFVRHLSQSFDDESFAYNGVMEDSVTAWPRFADARYWQPVGHLELTAHAAEPRVRGEVYAIGSAGSGRTTFLSAAGTPFQDQTKALGLDAKAALSKNVSLVGALNPDFSNVESDQLTIAPQEFRQHVADNRAFFAEGAERYQPTRTFATTSAPNVLFYSPDVYALQYGLKAEGFTGREAFGAMAFAGDGFHDEVYGLRRVSADRGFEWWLNGVAAHHDAFANTGDGRVGSDVSTDVGVAGHNLHTGLIYRASYGVERGTAVTSARQATKTEDFVDVQHPNFEVNAFYRAVGAQWNPFDGYTALSDVRGPGIFIDTSGARSKGLLKSYDVNVLADRFVDGSGAVHEADVALAADVQLSNGLHFSGGPSTSSIRYYDGGNAAVGYPFYRAPVLVPYNQHAVNVGYRDGTPAPVDASYYFGPFTVVRDGALAPAYVQETTISTARNLTGTLFASAEYDRTRERAAAFADGQQLVRATVGRSFGADSNASVSLRRITGTGGFASPGLNLAGNFHRRYRSGSELFVNYGAPASTTTIQRWIVKYIRHF